MMQYKNMLAFGFVILCCAVLIQSLNANAFPVGPNVSLGSNPVKSWAGKVGSGWHTLETLQEDLVITDLILSGVGDYCSATLSTQNSSTSSSILITGAFKNLNSNYGQGNSQFNGNLRSGVLVTAGSTLFLYIERYNGDCHYVISGYSTH